jgi:hypothetical protein
VNRFLTGPVGLAVMVTLANAVKPVLVDDTAYVAFARQAAAHPLDPYGGTIYWYADADRKMEILAPPVLPYWLGLGLRLFGDHPWALKLWLFPFVLLLAWSLRELLRRFARGTEPVMLPLLMFSPAILPAVNLMLDVPAVALGLAAVALFVRAVDRDSVILAAAAAVVAALAMQTKYTALLVPPVLGWCAVCRRQVGLGVLVALASIGAFALWEMFIALKYDGQSHFLYHAARQGGDKPNLLPPLAAYLGCLAVGIGLYAGRAVGWPRWVLAVSAGLWVVGVGVVAVLPHQATVIVHGKLALAAVVWRTAGAIVLLSAGAWAVILLFRLRRRVGPRWSADSLFLVGWVVLELVGYFVLTPFPAARRVIGPTVALGLLAARLVSRVSRARPDRKPPAWVLPFGAAVGFFVAGVDLYDAQPEKQLAGQAAAWVRANDPGAKVWFAGHWGFQFYCEREGMQPLLPTVSVAVGDYLVLPAFPDDKQFYRPDSENGLRSPPEGLDVKAEAEFAWDDRMSAQTIPNFYGGDSPVIGRDHPRLRIVVYRVVGVKEKPPG